MIKNRLKVKNGVPPYFYFMFSSFFHYLGPAFAVLLFAYIGIFGVLWFRIVTAAFVFALWKNPLKTFSKSDNKQRILIVQLGIILALMNTCFYIAISEIPLAVVATIEFLGPIILAFIGIKNKRNFLALALTLIGVGMLSKVQLNVNNIGLIFSLANCMFFMLYIIVGHKISEKGGISGAESLGSSMFFACFIIFPIGLFQAIPGLSSINLILAGIGVGLCSSVIPYILDQFAMSSLNRSTFALMLSLMPMFATIIGVIILLQIPSWIEIIGISTIIFGLLIHQENVH